jgi:hypothetical protein
MATRLSVAAISVVLALAFGVSRVGFGSVALARQTAAQEGTPAPQPNMQTMMKMHEQMMAEMKAADVKLDALVRDMNAAKGEARIVAMSAVVNELVQQHTAMHGRMGQMHQQMMGGRGGMMRQ